MRDLDDDGFGGARGRQWHSGLFIQEIVREMEDGASRKHTGGFEKKSKSTAYRTIEVGGASRWEKNWLASTLVGKIQ